MSDWLDLQLSHQLAPVQAPDALWDRIQQATGPRPAPRTTPALALWPVAAILTLMAAAGTLWLVAKGEQPSLDLRQLAIEQIRSGQPMELRSTDPNQISAWLRRAGLDVTLPAERGSSVCLLGARIIDQHGTRIGQIEYKVGADTATLLVAHAGSGPDIGHGQLAWHSRGQSFALASSNSYRLDAPCLLCHASL